METVIIKYNAGNIRSVLYALDRIGVKAVVTDDPEAIIRADKVIFPGVGEASTAMQYLRERGLDKVIAELKQPVLGICLGMQLLCRHSEENDADCLGVFPLQVKRFAVVPEEEADIKLKVPQIGWNNIFNLSGPLMEGVHENDFVYFVHSYYVEKGQYTCAVAHYGLNYSAAIRKDNFYAVQFHPEKSAEVGESMLRNFILNVNS